MLVVDASVAVKWFVTEPGSQEALNLAHRDEPLIAPELIVAEVVNAMWRRIVTGAIEQSQAEDVPRALAEMFAELWPMTPLASRALAIAAELRHPAYDCLYLALAERENARLITSDRRLLRRLEGTPWSERVQGLGH
jgi:predicted nucleic acid-binding protein